MSSPAQLLAERYLRNVRPSGNGNLRAECPFHHSTSSKRSLYVFTRTGAWTCFGCQAGGTIPGLLYKLGFNREQVDRALDLVDFKKWRPVSVREQAYLHARSGWDVLPEFILGAWDWCPQRMLWWGFREEILQEYDIGYDRVRERITFPIRDHLGRLVGISGRAEPGGFPRYKVYESVPANRAGQAGELYDVLDGSQYTPSNRMHLYGFEKFYAERLAQPEADDHPPFILVEGYKGTIWLAQLGFRHTAGLQGSSLTRHQEQVAGMVRGTKYVLLDNEPGKAFPDEFGRCAAYRITERLSRYGKALVCQYPEGSPIGTSPDDLSQAQLEEMIDNAVSTAKANYTRSARMDGWRRTKTNTRKKDS